MKLVQSTRFYFSLRSCVWNLRIVHNSRLSFVLPTYLFIYLFFGVTSGNIERALWKKNVNSQLQIDNRPQLYGSTVASHSNRGFFILRYLLFRFIFLFYSLHETIVLFSLLCLKKQRSFLVFFFWPKECMRNLKMYYYTFR